MRCPNCRKQNTMSSWEGSLTRMGVQILARGEKCSSCGEMLFDDSEVERQEKLLAAGLVERGIRKGAEFKLVRKVAGFKAVEIAAMLDVRPETLSRWESGDQEIPRLAAFALGELFQHPRLVREKLELFAR